MHFANLLIMRLELLPGLPLGQRFESRSRFPRLVSYLNLLLQLATAFLSAALLDSITASSSFQDLTNDFAPSS